MQSEDYPVQGTAEQWQRREARVSASRALSSVTRASIFDHLRSDLDAHTVRDVADRFALHPNVARTHLELLADAGLVLVGRRKHPGGGRPAKVYRTADADDVDGILPGFDEQAAARLQVRLLSDLVPATRDAEARAFEAGSAEGRRLVEPFVEDEAPDLPATADRAVRALRPHVGMLRVLKEEPTRVDVTGFRATFDPLSSLRPTIAEAFERGILEGAFVAAGRRVTVQPAGSLPEGDRVWRVGSGSDTVRNGPLAARRVDARGLPREQGVVRAMREIMPLRAGQVLEVLAEGPGSPAAFARWVDRAGHQLLAVERVSDEGGRGAIRLAIRKGGT